MDTPDKQAARAMAGCPRRPRVARAALAAAAWLLAGAAAAQVTEAHALSCPVADAHYTLRSDRSYSAEFVPVSVADGAIGQARMALHFRSAGSGQQFWLGIVQGNGYSYAQLYPIDNPALHDGVAVPRASTPDRTGDEGVIPMPLLVSGRDLDLRSAAPLKPGDSAPELFAVPNLGINYWYLPQLLSGAFNDSTREMMPLGFFELSSCGQQGADSGRR